MKWATAELYCSLEDAHLASVKNLNIYNYIQSKAEESVWLGGTDKEEEGKWRWSDGSAWELTKWATKPQQQPDNHEDQEDCLLLPIKHEEIKDGWNDAWCKHWKRFVCSKLMCADVHSNNNNKHMKDSTAQMRLLIIICTTSKGGVQIIKMEI